MSANDFYDALLACVPVVTREQLERVLDPYTLLPTSCNLVIRNTGLLDDLLRLCGGEETRIWCQHCLWEEDVGWRTEKDQWGGFYRLAEHLRACPVKGCVTPRPLP